MKYCLVTALLLLATANAAADDRPNILLIMADDMGWSDIGAYGGEIPTPRLDELAQNGVRFTQFYNMARCFPTRASLMTGLHPHQTGLGGSTNSPRGLIGDRGVFGYRGFLNRNSVTMAEVLGAAGYQTYLSGKWHLGYHTPDRWPRQRGFDRFYGSLAGATAYFRPHGARGMMLENSPLPPPQGDYYSTDAFTDHAMQFIEEGNPGQPFFLYLAYTAPHWPLHAPEEDIRKFRGQYRDVGWDRLREQRLQRMVSLGILSPGQALSARDPGARAWEALTAEQKDELDLRMAVYAAQVHRMDHNIGRLLDYLQEKGELDNTLIVFLSDNGGCAEPYDDLGGKEISLIHDESYSGMVSYGLGWANASNTPFRKFKVYLNEGGIATPLIVHWPAGLQGREGSWQRNPAWVPDLMPTFLEVANATYPERFNAYAITPLEGESLLAALRQDDWKRGTGMFWEHMNHRAHRDGDWKAVYEWDAEQRAGAWRLFDLAVDRQESHDLSRQEPERLASMAAAWERWAHRAYVYPKPDKLDVPNAPELAWPAWRAGQQPELDH